MKKRITWLGSRRKCLLWKLFRCDLVQCWGKRFPVASGSFQKIPCLQRRDLPSFGHKSRQPQEGVPKAYCKDLGGSGLHLLSEGPLRSRPHRISSCQRTRAAISRARWQGIMRDTATRQRWYVQLGCHHNTSQSQNST